METSLTTNFADDEYRFWLPMARVVAAEREMGASIFEVFDNLGRFLGQVADEVVLVGPSPVSPKQCERLIYNALVGGGADEKAAGELVSVYCYPARPAIRDMALVWKILEAAIYGIELKKKAESEDDPGEQSPSEKVA